MSRLRSIALGWLPPALESRAGEGRRWRRSDHALPISDESDGQPHRFTKTCHMSWMEWYDSLWKPSWTPAPRIIGLIWQILYPIIMVSFGFVFVQVIRRKIPWIAALPFAINLVANLVFMPIQFGMRNLPLATVDILVVWGTIPWIMIVIRKHYRWVAAAQVPYLVWVSIATVLQLSISWMNR